MDRMLYIAMNGASQTLQAQAANSHNLANVSTTGFRADLAAFRAMPVIGQGYPTRVYSMAESPGVDFKPGTVTATGRDLDIAVKGEGFIAVQAADGSEAYTRAGDLRLSTAGVLVTGAGHPVLGNGGPIAVPPAASLEISADGTLSIQPVGQSASTLSVVDRIKLVNPVLDDLHKGEDGLLRMKDASIAPASDSVGVISGSLESSNVNPVEAMVTMITLARQYEMQVKMMQVSQQNDESAEQILRLG